MHGPKGLVNGGERTTVRENAAKAVWRLQSYLAQLPTHLEVADEAFRLLLHIVALVKECRRNGEEV
jgi:hypothetical protein